MLAGTALLVTAGALNFGQRVRHETPPWDGVRWNDTKQGLLAETVQPGSAGARGQILPGDRLLAVSLDNRNYEQIARASDVQIYLDQAKVGGPIHYLIERPSYPEESRFYYADLDNLDAIHKWTPRDVYINLIGLVFLFVGFFVLFKQGGRAPFALHFASVCLAAFVFCFYTPVGSYRDLDLAIAFLRNAAFILFPPLFLHFCLLYPTRQQLFEEKRWRAGLLYAPAVLLLLLASFVFLRGVITPVVPGMRNVPGLSESFVGFFYKLSFFQFVAGLVASVFFLIRTWTRVKSAVVRQQMKWVIWGSLLAVAPFTLLYGIGFLLGRQADPGLTETAILPLVLIPLAFGYSVVRYRLMDVELVVRRVFVYVLTTLAIALMVGTGRLSGGTLRVGWRSGFHFRRDHVCAWWLR